MYRVAVALLAILVLVPAESRAGELRLAAWNLEHLDDAEGEGCVGWTEAAYAALARQVAGLDADVVAFQEVENEAAARRVFPASRWDVVVSSRPPLLPSRACWRREGAVLGHLATGFAIRRGLDWRRHPDLRQLGGDDGFQRWGTDVTVTDGSGELRLLSVHLRSGCWGEEQDRDAERSDTCDTLRRQTTLLRDWADARRAEGAAFVILGDFNRRLAVPGDWAWRLLSPSSAPLRLVTGEAPYGCDPRFSEFIDHIVAGGGAEDALVPGSFQEVPRQGPHPDHCAVLAAFGTGG